MISDIDFDPTNTQMFLIITPAPLTLVVLNALTGTMIASKSDPSSTYFSLAGPIRATGDPASGLILVGGTTPMPGFTTLVSMNLFSSPTSPTYS